MPEIGACAWSWLLLALALASPAWASELSPIKIGLVVPMAGEAGRVGQSMRQAAELAVADRAEKLVRKVELVLKDDQFDPKQAVLVAEKLVQEGVWGVVGHFYSSSSIPASAVYYQAGIPQVTATSTHPRLTAQGFDTVFRVSGRDDQHAVSAAEFILSRLKARRIAVIHDRTEYGRTLAETLIRLVEQRSAKRIVAIEHVAQGDRDFGAVIARLKTVAPDAVYFGGIFREGGYLIRQMRQAGLQAAFVSGDGVLDPEFVKIAGEEAASGAYLTFAPDPRLLPSAQPFIRRFEERYGPIGPYVLYTYDAMGVLLRAIQMARPLANTKEELRKVLKIMHTIPYDGTLGRLRWDKRGDLVTSPYVVYVTRRGGGLQGWFEQLTGIPAPGAGRGRPAGR
ncbi:MAG TPA: branched-chain amino acid ABC transporter substrate-binding protein [Candidatus Methylomirabilis sp.]